MRAAALASLIAVAAGCSVRQPSRSPTGESTASASPARPTPRAEASSPAPRARKACIRVGEDSGEVEVEGALRAGEDGRLLVLRLAEPRCVVGFAHATVAVEVLVVSEGFDLRPLVGRHIRAVGRALGDESAPEGPTIVVVARAVERLPIDPEP